MNPEHPELWAMVVVFGGLLAAIVAGYWLERLDD